MHYAKMHCNEKVIAYANTYGECSKLAEATGIWDKKPGTSAPYRITTIEPRKCASCEGAGCEKCDGTGWAIDPFGPWPHRYCQGCTKDTKCVTEEPHTIADIDIWLERMWYISKLYARRDGAYNLGVLDGLHIALKLMVEGRI